MRAGPPAAIVAITTVLLIGYLGICAWAWASPSGGDPQRGMAVGFLTMVTLFLLGLAALLWLGAARGHPRLVWTVFGLCALPSLSLVARGIYLLVRWIRGP